MPSGSVTRNNMKISAVNGTAFVDFSAADVLTGFVVGGGLYKLSIYDSALKAIIGYIKAAGSGETLGSEVIANGIFDPDTGWTKQNGWSISGGKAVKVSGTGNWIYQTRNLNLHGLYKGSMDVDALSGTTIALAHIGNGTTNEDLIPRLNTTGTKTGYGTARGGASTPVGVTCLTATGSATIDNVSLKQVLTPSVTGVTITSTADGTTYNWASKESGFNYNDASGYTYEILDITSRRGMSFRVGTRL